MDGVEVVLSNRGMMVEAARKIRKNGETICRIFKDIYKFVSVTTMGAPESKFISTIYFVWEFAVGK